MVAVEAVAIADVAIDSVAIVDVVHGRITSPRTVYVIDGRISSVGEPGAGAPVPAAERIDGRGLFLMPGLVDMHVHLFNNASHRPPNDWTFPLFVANGVTAVREMNARPADLQTMAQWRAAAARAELVAPRVLAAGVPVGGDSLDDLRRQVREARAAGADFVKIFSEITESQWHAILVVAREEGAPVSGHVPSAVSVLAAASAGLRSDEHLTQVYEACSMRGKQLVNARHRLSGEDAVALRDAQEKETLETFDAPTCEVAAAALAATGQVQVPTLVLPYVEARGVRSDYRDDTRWPLLRPDEQDRWGRNLDPESRADAELASLRWQVSREIVGALQRAGVRFLAGTDTPMPLVYPGYSLHEELELLVESGLSPANAIRAATLGPAEFLGLSESSGSIAVGKVADLLLLEADPLSDVGNTRRIRAVVLDGRVLLRADLDALLAGARH